MIRAHLVRALLLKVLSCNQALCCEGRKLFDYFVIKQLHRCSSVDHCLNLSKIVTIIEGQLKRLGFNKSRKHEARCANTKELDYKHVLWLHHNCIDLKCDKTITIIPKYPCRCQYGAAGPGNSGWKAFSTKLGRIKK